MTRLRKTRFFLDPEEAHSFAENLRNTTLTGGDVVVVLAKNKEDCARGVTALARIEGAHVNWTESPT